MSDAAKTVRFYCDFPDRLSDAVANFKTLPERMNPTLSECNYPNPSGASMKITMKKHRKYLLAGGLLLATATPSFALFGIGDIVFDPTSYASLVSQLTTLESQYNMLKNNVTHFSLKQQWQTTLTQLKNVNVANMFGETAGMSIALNTIRRAGSITAWKTATVPVNSSTSTFLKGQTVGSSTQLSQLAMIEWRIQFHLTALRRLVSIGRIAARTKQPTQRSCKASWTERPPRTARFSS